MVGQEFQVLGWREPRMFSIYRRLPAMRGSICRIQTPAEHLVGIRVHSSPMLLCYSTKSEISTTEDQAPTEISAAKILSSLGAVNAENSELSQEEADVEAREWLQAINDVRQELIGEGKGFDPNTAFSSEGAKEMDLLKHSQEVAAESQKFKPNLEQQLEADRLKALEIPVQTDPMISYLTNVVMRHGKKSKAQKFMTQALYLVHLRTRKDPIELLKNTLEEMSPLVKLKRFTDGGARVTMMPTPLNQTQRLRFAWNWILEGSEKRPSKSFSVRLAEEIISASKGSGSGYEKRTLLHKSAMSNRAYIKTK